MSAPSMLQVKELRDRTQAGLNDCKGALSESGGDMEKAVEIILKKGLAKSAKRAGAVASEGVVVTAVTPDGKRGVIVEVNIQTDSAARNADFLAFADKVSQVALKAKQSDMFKAQLAEDPKAPPAASHPKIIEGKLAKWAKEICLLDQQSVLDGDKTVDQIRIAVGKELGGDVVFSRFVRFERGEGIDKPTGDDFAAEVAKMAGG